MFKGNYRYHNLTISNRIFRVQKITPNLWFDHQAEEAAKFYVSVFKNAKILSTTHYDEASAAVSGMPVGSVLTFSFQLDGQEFVTLNGGPIYTFSPAISLSIACATQAEVDRFWETLSKGGAPGQCGWLTDKYGVSWQVVPTVLPKMLADKDPARVSRVLKALLPMTKIEVAVLEKAFKG
jgi:predicted 3-demethylubiquinone-9 3-methyltransferase (glyoxalase superfamily)